MPGGDLHFTSNILPTLHTPSTNASAGRSFELRKMSAKVTKGLYDILMPAQLKVHLPPSKVCGRANKQRFNNFVQMDIHVYAEKLKCFINLVLHDSSEYPTCGMSMTTLAHDDSLLATSFEVCSNEQDLLLNYFSYCYV